LLDIAFVVFGPAGRQLIRAIDHHLAIARNTLTVKCRLHQAPLPAPRIDCASVE
jgi:hypothetical protein